MADDELKRLFTDTKYRLRSLAEKGVKEGDKSDDTAFALIGRDIARCKSFADLYKVLHDNKYPTDKDSATQQGRGVRSSTLVSAENIFVKNRGPIFSEIRRVAEELYKTVDANKDNNELLSSGDIGIDGDSSLLVKQFEEKGTTAEGNKVLDSDKQAVIAQSATTSSSSTTPGGTTPGGTTPGGTTPVVPPPPAVDPDKDKKTNAVGDEQKNPEDMSEAEIRAAYKKLLEEKKNGKQTIENHPGAIQRTVYKGRGPLEGHLSYEAWLRAQRSKEWGDIATNLRKTFGLEHGAPDTEKVAELVGKFDVARTRKDLIDRLEKLKKEAKKNKLGKDVLDQIDTLMSQVTEADTKEKLEAVSAAVAKLEKPSGVEEPKVEAKAEAETEAQPQPPGSGTPMTDATGWKIQKNGDGTTFIVNPAQDKMWTLNPVGKDGSYTVRKQNVTVAKTYQTDATPPMVDAVNKHTTPAASTPAASDTPPAASDTPPAAQTVAQTVGQTVGQTAQEAAQAAAQALKLNPTTVNKDDEGDANGRDQ